MQNTNRKDSETAPANLNSLPASMDYYLDSTFSLPNASDPNVVGVQTETSVDTCNDTRSYSLADTTNLDKPMNDDKIVAGSKLAL